jgi:hypothetical protein
MKSWGSSSPAAVTSPQTTRAQGGVEDKLGRIAAGKTSEATRKRGLNRHHTTSLTSSRGNAARPREAARTDEIRTHSASCGIGRSAAIKAATGAYMICSLAVLRPIPGRDHRAAPKGSAPRCRTRAAPYTSPSSALIWSCSCSDLSSVVRCRVATRLLNRATCPALHHAPAPEPPWLDTHEKQK